MKNDFKLKKRRDKSKRKFGQIMNCLCSGEQGRPVEMVTLSETQGTEDNTVGDYVRKDYSGDALSSKFSEVDQKPDTSNIEEAELSLRESGSLNYEEARALLGRIEYQKGNIQAALHVFEGIDITSLTPKMKYALGRLGERRKRQTQSFSAPVMSIHAASLLLEATFLKAKSLQHLQRFKDAAQACKLILDIVESSVPEGLPVNLGAELKLQEILTKAVELLPELWKLADIPREAIMSYRRALLHQWNLDAETVARIQKEFAIFLLYSGGEASPLDLRSQMDSSFVPKNNIEEAILLLMILLRKVYLKKIEWDGTILDHLSFALAVSGDLMTLAKQLEELLPGVIERKDRYWMLSLCYCEAGKDLDALNLLQKLVHPSEDPNSVPGLLLASNICTNHSELAEEGVGYARRALENLNDECNQLESTSNRLLGVSLLVTSKLAVSDSERVLRQSEALQVLETAGRMTRMQDPDILYSLSLENAEQRKLDTAFYYAKRLLKLEGGINIKGWLLLARILSAQKRFEDAEIIINAALDQTGKWEQGELLITKAKLQIAIGQLKGAIGTYTRLLAVLQVQRKSFGFGKKVHMGKASPVRLVELEVWHDLSSVYISLSQWRDAEICLAKSQAICTYSASRFHTTGLLYEKKGLHQAALKAFMIALDIDPTHVPSLVSAAVVLRNLNSLYKEVVRSFLMEALRLDRMNSSAWYNLGLLCKEEGKSSSAKEAAECFEAAALLEESAPVEPFR